jgi:methanol metabolism-related c-type cytochrome
VNRLGLGLFAAAGVCLAAGVAFLRTGAEAEVSPAPKADIAASAVTAAVNSEATAPAATNPAPKVEAVAPAGAVPVKIAEAQSDKSAVPDPAFEKQHQDGKKLEAGKWVLPDGTPTYEVIRDTANTDIVKKVDWYTYSGWRRYHAECHVCHGPNAEGSTFAPALKDSLKQMDYAKFMQVVSSGQQRDVAGTKYIMPALGDNKNVMCYIDDLYIYLRARSTDALPGGRLSADQRAEKPKEAAEYEKSCLGE